MKECKTMHYRPKLTVYIGYDPREHKAAKVCENSITRRLSDSFKVDVKFLVLSELMSLGYYTRSFFLKNGQMYDDLDNKPFSTEFSFSRFLVPYLNNYEGFAVFMDCDMALTTDIYDVLLEFLNHDNYKEKAVGVVKHEYTSTDAIKMDGVVQTNYPRKNWSSFIVFNCSHPKFKNGCLDPDIVNNSTGSYLHQFRWLEDHEILSLDPAWNVLLEELTAYKVEKPKVLHWTLGGPWFKGYEKCSYNSFWYDELEILRRQMVNAANKVM